MSGADGIQQPNNAAEFLQQQVQQQVQQEVNPFGDNTQQTIDNSVFEETVNEFWQSEEYQKGAEKGEETTSIFSGFLTNKIAKQKGVSQGTDKYNEIYNLALGWSKLIAGADGNEELTQADFEDNEEYWTNTQDDNSIQSDEPEPSPEPTPEPTPEPQDCSIAESTSGAYCEINIESATEVIFEDVESIYVPEHEPKYEPESPGFDTTKINPDFSEDIFSKLNTDYNLNIDFSNPENITDEQIEQLRQAYTIETQAQNLDQTKEQMLNYFDSLGVIDEAYDGVKDILGFGLTREDVENYYNNEQQKMDFLSSVVQNGGTITVDSEVLEKIQSFSSYSMADIDNIKEGDTIDFNQAYSIATGTQYNPQLISNVMNSQDAYAAIVQMQQQSVAFESIMSNSSPAQALEYFNVMAQSTEGATGEELFNNYYANLFEQNPDKFQGQDNNGLTCKGIEIKDGYLWQELSAPEGYDEDTMDMIAQSDFLYKEVDEEGNAKYYKVVNLEDEHKVLSNLTGEAKEYDQYFFADKKDDPTYSNHPLQMFYKANDSIRDNNLYLEQTKQNYNEEFGENAFDTILEEYPKMYEEAFGNNVLADKLGAYEQDMDSYASKISQAASFGCFAASFIPGVNLGMGIILASVFSDNIIDGVNIASSNLSADQKLQQAGQLLKNTGIEVGMLAVGMGINKFANVQGNKFVADKIAKGSEFVMNHAVGIESAAEYAIDNLASVAWDLGKGLMDGSFTNPDGTINTMALLQTVGTNLLFNSADLRGGMSLYRKMSAGQAVDIGNGTKFQIDGKTGSVKYTYADNSQVKIENGKATYTRADGTTSNEIKFDQQSGSWKTPDGVEIDLNSGVIKAQYDIPEAKSSVLSDGNDINTDLEDGKKNLDTKDSVQETTETYKRYSAYKDGDKIQTKMLDSDSMEVKIGDNEPVLIKPDSQLKVEYSLIETMQKILEFKDKGLSIDEAKAIIDEMDTPYGKVAELDEKNQKYYYSLFIDKRLVNTDLSKIDISDPSSWRETIRFNDIESDLEFMNDVSLKHREAFVKQLAKDTQNLVSVDKSDLEENFEMINLFHHGSRIDQSLSDITFEIGGKKIKLNTDNNTISEKFAQQNGFTDPNKVLTDSTISRIETALKYASEHGLEIPENIYLTDLFEVDSQLGHKAYGYFGSGNESIFFNMDAIKDDDFLTEAVYHELAHYKDYLLGKPSDKCELTIGEYISDNNGAVVVQKNTVTLPDGTVIKPEDITSCIREYASRNNAEFVAEVTANLLNGNIVKLQDGTYRFKNRIKNISLGKKLNNIMKLYNYMTEGKIV